MYEYDSICSGITLHPVLWYPFIKTTRMWRKQWGRGGERGGNVKSSNSQLWEVKASRYIAAHYLYIPHTTLYNDVSLTNDTICVYWEGGTWTTKSVHLSDQSLVQRRVECRSVQARYCPLKKAYPLPHTHTHTHTHITQVWGKWGKTQTIHKQGYVQQQVVYTPTKQTKNHCLQEEEAHTNLNRANLPVQSKFKLF